MADPNFFGLTRALNDNEKTLINNLIKAKDLSIIEQKKIHTAVATGLGEYLKNHNPLNLFNHRSQAQQDLNTLGTIKAALMVVKKYLGGSEHSNAARNTIPINSRADYILSALNKDKITVTSQTTIHSASQPST